MHPVTPPAIGSQSDRLIDLIRKRTANLFKTRQLWCSAAVLSVLNRSLGGDLPDAVAIRLGAGLGEGIGGSGCTCGALTGGVMAIGLFCGTAGTGLHRSHCARTLSHNLHDQFKHSYGSTCCRVLTRGLVQGTKAHFEQCAELSAAAAAMAAAFIIDVQPERIAAADWDFLDQRDSYLKARLKVVGDLFKP